VFTQPQPLSLQCVCFGVFWSVVFCFGVFWGVLGCFGVLFWGFGVCGFGVDLGCFGVFWSVLKVVLGCFGVFWGVLLGPLGHCLRRLVAAALLVDSDVFELSTCGVRFRAPARWARLSPQLPTRTSRQCLRRCSTTKSLFATNGLQ
jgi:hypothetical protein